MRWYAFWGRKSHSASNKKYLPLKTRRKSSFRVSEYDQGCRIFFKKVGGTELFSKNSENWSFSEKNLKLKLFKERRKTDDKIQQAES